MIKKYKTLRVPQELIEVLDEIKKNIDSFTYNAMPRVTYADLMRILAKKYRESKG